MSDAVDRWLVLSGQRIRYRITSAEGKPRGRVLILPGFTEFIEKHAPTVQRLAALGLESLVIDWPGQGLSGRLAPGYPQIIHCRDFRQHFNAIRQAAQAEGFLDGALPLFLFGHSMGGHLALRLIGQIEPPLAGVVLSAPMMMPPVLPPRLVLTAAAMLCRAGFARRPVLGRQGKSRDEHFYALNPLTRSPEGYRFQVDLWHSNPDLKTTGPSYGWVRAAYASCLATTGKPAWLAQIDCPIQAHTAGHEVVVSALHSHRMLPKIPGIERYHYDGARHELLLELPEVTEQIWQRIGAFVDRRLA